GLLALLNPGQPQVNEAGAGDKDAHSSQRCPNGSGGLLNTDTYIQDMPTPGAANCFVPLPDILINEVDSDTAGTDVLEFVELFDGGAGNTPLDGLVLVFYNGSSDTSYAAYDLDGYATDAAGYFLLGNEGVTPTPAIIFSSNGLQNGADAVALYSGDEAAFPYGTALTTDSLLDAVVYDTDDSDDSGLLALLNPGQPQVNEAGAGDKDAHSSQRCPNGSGGLRNTETFTQDFPTPAAANCAAPPEACGDPFTPVYTIQGAGTASLLDGAEVAVEGVVTGDFQAGDELSGFFIQDPFGDGDAGTSDGMFIYAPAGLDVAEGDSVRVRGIVDEYYDLTEITNVSSIWLCGEGEAISPTALDLPIADLGQWETLEGMLLTFPEALTVTEHYNLGRYGELLLSADGRLYNPTNDQGGSLDLIERRVILLDDHSTVQNPATVPYLGLDDTIRLGDVTVGLTGVLSYDFGVYRLQPTGGDVAFARLNERTAAPDAVGGTTRVASFNVLNYFTTIDDGSNHARGADSIEEFERQQAKIVEAILAIDADVAGLIEIENNGPVAVENLVAALNAASEPGRYAAIADPPAGIGDDAIKVAIIYQPARVTPVGPAMTDLNPIFDRPPVAQTFDASGEIFSVIVNHFKSKGSCPSDPSDPNTDQGDGQGCWNLRRTQQAAQLLVFTAAVEAASGDADVIVLGDLNAYGQEDPVNLLVSGGLLNQVAAFISLDERYSYVFDGQAGYLDHTLTTVGLQDRVTGVDIWHINADEPRVLDYNQEFNPPYLFDGEEPYRSSDHDPVILGFCESIPPEITITLTPDVLWPPNHQYVEVEAAVGAADNVDPAPVITFISVASNEPDNGEGDGNTVDDIIVVDDFHFLLRAERAGGGSGRIYTVYYAAEDACGNVTLGSATVTVPRAHRLMRWEKLQTMLNFGG
ncbi:MAG: ExeM/NucH family extracellular endonuclease, partial [Anaerolineales bacterium]|nr:ExeM/NucH family extracellular endonuclease [Anaerolineales bacterium]